MNQNQLTFAFSREKRLAMIDAAEFVDLTRPSARRVKALLMHLELVSGREGCFPSIELLAARMATTDRTIRRTLRLAESLGLVTTYMHALPRIGRRENHYRVHWDRLATYVPAPALAEIDRRVERRAPMPGRDPFPPDVAPSATPQNLSARPQNCPVASGPPVRSRAVTVSGHTLRYTQKHVAPPPGPAPGFGAEGCPTDQAALEGEVFRAGVDRSNLAVSKALAAGCTADEIRRAIEAFRARPDLGAGALFVKLATMRPGEPVERNWPAVDPDAKRVAYARQRGLQARQEADAIEIIKAGHKAGKSDSEIRAELDARQLPWP